MAPSRIIVSLGSVAALGAAAHAGVEGGVRAWGYNATGQCNVPSGLPLMAWIDGGSNHTIALQNNGVVRAWGQNTYGQSNVPTNLGVVIDVTAGFGHSVALISNGTVRCWGLNDFGQCAVPGMMSCRFAIIWQPLQLPKLKVS